jgi:hypothetical protein
MENALVWLLPVAMTAMLGWQLLTGKLLDRNWRLWTTRQERPTFYWSMVGLQSLITLFAWGVSIFMWNGPLRGRW